MSEFILSDGIDEDKIFLVDYSSLDNRYDPKFYHKNFTDNIDRIKNNNYSKLNDVIEFSSETWNQKDYFEDTFPYIEISKINTLTGIIEEIKKVEKYKAPSRAKMIVRNNDIIISTTRPDRGAISYVRTNNILIASTGFSILRDIKNNIITKKYLFYILKLPLVLQQFNQRSSGGNYPAITQEEISKVIIPTPPKPIQQNIIDIMDKAYLSKKQKEKQANELLESIDTYLLDELGITLPEVDNSLDKRIFEVKLSEIENRLEPHYYIEYFQNLESSIQNGLYRTKKLSDLCDLLNGYAFKSKDYVTHSDTLNIRMSNIRPNNSFNPDYKIKFLPNSYANLYKHYLLADGDLIIAMTDMASEPKILGVPTIVNNSNNRKLLLNQRVGKLFDFNLKLITRSYLYNILGSKPLKDYYNQQGARGVQINISRKQILNAKIPLPPIEKQNEIAEHIQTIRDKAKQLKLEAVQELESAKAEVEKMILGL